MNTSLPVWRSWSTHLKKWGVSDWAAAFIESAGPFGLLGAQFIYLGEPVLRLVVSTDQTRALARVLEDPEEARKFAAFIREGQVS